METEFESSPFIFMTLLKLECIWYQRPTYRFLSTTVTVLTIMRIERRRNPCEIVCQKTRHIIMWNL